MADDPKRNGAPDDDPNDGLHLPTSTRRTYRAGDLIIDPRGWSGGLDDVAEAERPQPEGPWYDDGRLIAGTWHFYPRARMYTYAASPTVRVEAWRDLGYDPWQVRRLMLVAPALNGLQLAPERARHRVAKAVGAGEPQLGDADFDEAVWVSAGTTAELLGRFDVDVRTRLVELVRWGATVSDGALHLNHPDHDNPSAFAWDPYQMLPPLCALADALREAPLAVEIGLERCIRHDPSPAVRARATAAWLTEIDWHQTPAAPDVLSDALVLLLDDKTLRPQAIERLAEVGDERAVAPLTALARGWFGGDEAKAAGAAVEAITRRLGGLRTAACR